MSVYHAALRCNTALQLQILCLRVRVLHSSFKAHFSIFSAMQSFLLDSQFILIIISIKISVPVRAPAYINISTSYFYYFSLGFLLLKHCDIWNLTALPKFYAAQPLRLSRRDLCDEKGFLNGDADSWVSALQTLHLHL